MKKHYKTAAVLILAILLIVSCAKRYYFRSNYSSYNQIIHESSKPYLKAHGKNGDVYILTDQWSIDSLKQRIKGSGSHYDYNRKLISEGPQSILLDSIAIFETNQKITKPEAGRVRALSIMAGLDVVMGLFCLAVPKACFGSCPTFYLNEHDNFHYADAEGFSNAISPSLEYADIDALNQRLITGDTFSLIMKNEALETHCIRRLKILAYPLEKGERVYQTPSNEFLLCGENYPLKKAIDGKSDISSFLQNPDRMERFSLSDEKNLASSESIYLDFDNTKTHENLGLVLNFRQSLMTTYFIYNAIAYMGDEVGDFFAKIETNQNARQQLFKDGIKKELGNIDIYSWDEVNKNWEFQGKFYETGPIAINRQILPLKTKLTGSKIRLKIVMNKGLWRLDYAGLTEIKKKIKPIEVSPVLVSNEGRIDTDALKQISSGKDYLISMPGSEYRFRFQMPQADKEYELFLHSEGYYLEWMRAHWLKEKNLPKLRQMLKQPGQYLKDEAAAYKAYEKYMEDQFWNSKIDSKSVSYYDN